VCFSSFCIRSCKQFSHKQKKYDMILFTSLVAK
jgi:hypothetical protein